MPSFAILAAVWKFLPRQVLVRLLGPGGPDLRHHRVQGLETLKQQGAC